MSSYLNEHGRYREALDSLSRALSYVNKHHELYYHCLDTTDRLKPFIAYDSVFAELTWINQDDIKTVPEWIARIREQLSVAYAGLGLKVASDYNRNIYLDILDYTRQDKELESRYLSLEKESKQLNVLLSVVLIGFVLLIILFWFFNRRWKIRNRRQYNGTVVEIYLKYEKVAVHKRSYKPYGYTFLPEHQASSQRVITEWNPEKFLKEAACIHTDVENYIRHVIEAKPYPEQAYKSCRGILSFASRVGKKRLINACRWASSYGLYNYPAIEEILKNRQDELPLDKEMQEEETGMHVHENIHGKEYYN